MASTSSTSFVQKSFKYDVFISFRGEDTRHNFVSHLYKALVKNGILTYKDDERIEKGETIDTHLIKSIEDSKFYIIVFSKNYASSSWCLDELVKIMECRKTSEQTAYPVFYDVEPTEIRKQSGAVKEAFQKHENKEAAGKWRKALNEAGNLAGWESKKTANGDESKLIQIIVDDIFQTICSSGSSADGNLVGMETRIEDLLSSLELDDPGVRMIGIWGMGGGGKTTLATASFNQICHQFEGSSFVDNVREVSNSSLSGLKELQKQILTDIFSDQNITVSSVSGGKNKMVQMMHRKKVLVVLDDVDSTNQLEALAGDPNWYKPGSRIIITTRDEQVLVAHRVDFINDVSLLSHTEAIRLFNRYAFTKETPIPGHKELSRQVVKYAHGLPLTIKVLGSFLCGQNETHWRDTLERLKTIPLKETMKILEISYDALDDDYKQIFLDVVCILKGWWKDHAVIALESCGFHAKNGLRVLEQRSLITISEYGKLGMHDHIEEMGKNIVRRHDPNEPKRHSRLWIEEEIEEISANDSGTQPATQCIKRLNAEGLNFEMLMKGLANMKELRFLQLDTRYVVSADQVSNWNLPNGLRFLRWKDYPFSNIPNTLQAKGLVGLEMINSNLVQVWENAEAKPFLNLRFLKLYFLKKLRTLDLSVAPNLETLILKDCYKLVEVHFQVTPNLKELRIHRCNSLEKLHMPAESPKLISLELKTLKLKCTKLRTLDLELTPNLESLTLELCYDLEEINAPAECLKKLLYLDIIHCGRFKSFKLDKKRDLTEVVSLPELHLTADAYDASYDAYDTDDADDTDDTYGAEDTENIDDADDTDNADGTDDADDTHICDPGNTWPEFRFWCYYKEDPASSFGNLESLISLGFGPHINIDSFSDIICGLQGLRKLTLKGVIPEAPKNLDRLYCLEELSLRSTYIKTLPDSMLKHLKSLKIVSCCLLEKLLEDIGRLQCLKKLIVKNCIILRDIPNSICEMDRLQRLDLTGCFRIDELSEVGCLEYVKELNITGSSITRLPKSLYLRIIGDEDVDGDGDIIFLRDIPNSICETHSLEYLDPLTDGTGITRLMNLKGLGIRVSTQIFESCGVTPQIQMNVDDGDDYIEDGDGDGDHCYGGEDDDNDNDAEDVNGDCDHDDNDEFDYEYARTLIMTLLGSRT